MKEKTWGSGLTLAKVERDAIESALKHYKGNRTHAAKGLGISRACLQNKLRAYKLEDVKRGKK